MKLNKSHQGEQLISIVSVSVRYLYIEIGLLCSGTIQEGSW